MVRDLEAVSAKIAFYGINARKNTEFTVSSPYNRHFMISWFTGALPFLRILNVIT